MSRILFPPRAILSAVVLTAALLGTACNDSTAPSKGERADAGFPETQLPGNPDEQLTTKSDFSDSAPTVPSLTAELATQAVAQDGTDTIAHIGGAGDDAAIPAGARAGDVIPGQFIVMLKEDVRDVPGLSKKLTDKHHGKLRHTFKGIKAFSAALSDGEAEALRRDPSVSSVEPNRVAAIEATQLMPTGSGEAWGLDRIDQVRRPLSGSMTYSHTGAGVYAYIIDSGIRSAHPEFGGRAVNVATAYNDNGEDCAGHGTHVAGIVGGKTYGVAKQVRLRGVKVLDCNGHSSNELVVKAIDWVYLYHASPAVANISLGSTKDLAVNAATTRLVNSGVFVAVAAGNDSRDACLDSPGSAAGTFTVASSTSADARAWDSNGGACVDAYAPGYQIRSAGLYTYSKVMSGTSMAAPHVTGVAALLKQAYGNVSSATLVSTLKSWSTQGVISGSYGSTPNRLLYKGGL